MKIYAAFAAGALTYPILLYILPVRLDESLDRGPGDLVGQDGATTNHIPLANLPAIFTAIISFPSCFTTSRRHSKPYEMLRPVGNTYNQGFDFIDSGNAIHYGYPAEVQVKPFGFVILGWLSICLLPAALIYVLEVGVKTFLYYTVLACNKLFGTRQQPFYNPVLNPGVLTTSAATALAHIGWVLISIPTSVVTLLARIFEQVGKGVSGLAYFSTTRYSSLRISSGSNNSPSLSCQSLSPTHASAMSVNGESKPLLPSNDAKRDGVSQSDDAGQDLSQRDSLQDPITPVLAKVTS